jgi:CRP-like cAMP-binding protein
LLEQGQPVLGCYSICRGWLKVARRTVRGKIAGVDLRGPGELIGARELLADEPHFDIYAQAIDDVQTIWLDRAYLLDLMSRFPEIARAVSRRVAQINGAVQRRLSHALHAGLEEKIAYLLSYLHQKQTFVQLWGGGAGLRTSVQEHSLHAITQ